MDRDAVPAVALPARSEPPTRQQPRRPKGTAVYYAAAVLCTVVSLTTSWQFFTQRLRIPNTIAGHRPLFGFLGERAVMFAVLELALVASGIAMRAGVRGPTGKPGPARVLAWALCGVSGYMAVMLSGPVTGLVRVAIGPVLALVTFHLALGIEIRVKHSRASGTWVRVRQELEQRALSRLGLGNTDRSAAELTRDRALRRAARLAAGQGFGVRREARLAKAVYVSGAAESAALRAKLVEQTAALRHVNDLRDQDLPSPWLIEQTEAAAGGSADPAGAKPRAAARRSTGKAGSDTGAAIRRIRSRYPDMSHVDIAKRLQISTKTVSRHLNGSSGSPQPDVA